MTQQKFFKLYSQVIPVRGASAGIICDLQESYFVNAPNIICKAFEESEFHAITVEQIEGLGFAREEVRGLLVSLEEKKLGFWTVTPQRFPLMDLEYKGTAAVITNAILDITLESKHPYQKIVKELGVLGCTHLQIRIFGVSSSEEFNQLNLVELLEFINQSSLLAIEIIMPYLSKVADMAKHMFYKNNRILSLLLYGAPQDKVLARDSHGEISLGEVRKDVEPSNHCGLKIDPFTAFSTSIPSFTEAVNRNSCLNQKLGIDHKGQVKNCPTMVKVFGNIKTDSLLEIVRDPYFQDIWNLSKDQIEVCKDCQYRYVCSDCRAHLKDQNNPVSKPLGCEFDPYTNHWR